MRRFLIVLLIISSLPSIALAADEGYSKQLEGYDFSFFEQSLGEDAYDMLRELGIEDFDYTDIYSVSLNDVVGLVFKALKNSLKAPAQGIISVLVFIILSSFFQSVKSGGSDMSGLYSTVSALIISALLCIKLNGCITLACASVGIASDFIYAFVPVFAAIVAASGGITTSFSTNTLLLLLSQGLSFISSKLFLPLINCFLAIGICGGLRAELNLHRLISVLKKLITTLLSFTSGLFISVLSLKTTVSAKADMLGLRGLRFAITSVVPVVGGALSEGLTSIQSYSSLIKTSVGVVGMTAVGLVFLPPLASVLLWRGAISLSALTADVFDDSSVRLTLTAFNDALLLIETTLIVSMLTCVVSIGILVAANTGGG